MKLKLPQKSKRLFRPKPVDRKKIISLLNRKPETRKKYKLFFNPVTETRKQYKQFLSFFIFHRNRNQERI